MAPTDEEMLDDLSSAVKQEVGTLGADFDKGPPLRRLGLGIEVARKIELNARDAAIDMAVRHLRESEASATPIAARIDELLKQKHTS